MMKGPGRGEGEVIIEGAGGRVIAKRAGKEGLYR